MIASPLPAQNRKVAAIRKLYREAFYRYGRVTLLLYELRRVIQTASAKDELKPGNEKYHVLHGDQLDHREGTGQFAICVNGYQRSSGSIECGTVREVRTHYTVTSSYRDRFHVCRYNDHLMVTFYYLKHKHPRSKFIFDRFPVNRRLTNEELKECSALLKYRIPSSEIQQYVAGHFGKMMGGHYRGKTFVMDKMTSQMRAAKAVFGCDIMLCYFHARQAIQKRTISNRSRHIFHRIACFDNAAGTVTNNRLENATGRLKRRVHHADSLEHAIQEVIQHSKWLMREYEMHITYYCDRRKIREGDRYVLPVVSQMTTYAANQVLRHIGTCTPNLIYHQTVRFKVATLRTPILGIQRSPVPLRPQPSPVEGLHKQLERMVGKLKLLEPRGVPSRLTMFLVVSVANQLTLLTAVVREIDYIPPLLLR
ncbi:hypothetical protein CLF_110478 [Clonorchis sinensis]|uniref:Uncharacterized protein n=1 Tax=Clonorchis sinensis TaxID=79923 RepID=G7YKR9_CLOSI|nr:hypothetical protein CLF_110478 [Clonorchis sinensis]